MSFFRRSRTSTTLIALLCTVSGTLALPARALSISDQSVATLTNQQRTANGLTPLGWNAALSNSAWLKAQDMCVKQYWAHSAPDGATGWTFMSTSGYVYVAAGENLAKGFDDDNAVIAGWMNSPTHRANILNANFREIGVASLPCAVEGTQTVLIVAHYGSTAQSAKPTQAPAYTPPQPAQPTKTAAKTPPVAVLAEEIKLPEFTHKQKPWEKLWNMLPLRKPFVLISGLLVGAYQRQAL